ncbi:MAG: choice-of-anchor D domain-containing protein, partial [Candidatus Viridilinea halotolerans]
SSPILTNVSFINNWAEYGGAIYNDGEDGGVSSPTLTNVTFTNNRAAEDGGAIYNYGYQGISSPTLTHVSFTSNWADDDGGAIYNDGEDGVSSPTLTNVTFTRNRAEYYGGAIYNDGQDGVSSPTLTDVTFNNNRAEYGGAIYNDGQSAGESSPILIDVTFSSNWAEYDGGAIYNYGYQGFSNPTLTDVTFSNNWAGSDGGAIYNDGEEGVSSPTLTNVIFIGSQAEDDGGAIYNDGEDGVSSPILTNVSFTGNWAGIDGGAIYNYGYQGVSSPTLTNVSFTGNWAGSDGGAIYNDGEDGVSSPNLTNVSFINNRAEDDGGAIYFDGDNGDVSATIINGLFVANGTDHIAYDDGNENTQPQFVNCTFVGATAQAINITYWDSGETPIDFVNSIFWGNNRLVDFTDDDPEVAPATMVNINYSIVEEASYASANNNLFADPLFLSAATGNYRLLASSPAVDSGDNSAVVGVTTDLDGNARTIGATVDRGAYEYGASNLAISKLVSPNSAVPYQGLITYTITLSNSGTIADASVVFTDTLPAGVEFVQWITQADANEQGGTLTWSGAIQPATARTWSFQARHTGNYGDVITNTAHFSGSDRTGAASATFSVVAALPGYVSIPTPDSTISLGSIQVGDSLTSTLTISNTGSGMLTISNSQISGAGAAAFSLVSPPVFPLSIASGGPSEMLQIVCNPTAAGVLTATLTLNTNDTTQSSVSYPLTCTGLAAPEPEPEDPSTRIFLPVVMKGN